MGDALLSVGDALLSVGDALLSVRAFCDTRCGTDSPKLPPPLDALEMASDLR